MTSHPPDEYTQQARSLLERMTPKPYATDVEAVAEAIADAYRRGAEEMREQAKGACERMVVGGRAWTAEQALAAEVLFAARDEIAALALPTGPAAPAGEEHRCERSGCRCLPGCMHDEDMPTSHMPDCPSQPRRVRRGGGA